MITVTVSPLHVTESAGSVNSACSGAGCTSMKSDDGQPANVLFPLVLFPLVLFPLVLFPLVSSTGVSSPQAVQRDTRAMHAMACFMGVSLTLKEV